jgi:hypothetical protein
LWDVPDPEQRDIEATEPVITLITCSELFHTDNRSVAIGDLDVTQKGQPDKRPSPPKQDGFLNWLASLIQGIIDKFQGK